MSNRSRTYYAKVNAVSLLLKEVIALLCNFLLPKLILSYFGSSFNGLASSITQFLNIISLFRLGVAGAARYSFYKPLSTNNNEELSTAVNTFQKYMNKTAIFTAIYIVALAVLFPIFYNGKFVWFDTLIMVVALGSATLAQYVFGLVYKCVITADQKSYVIYIVESICNVLATSISCLLIVSHFSLPIVKLIASVIWIIQPVIIFIYVRKKYKINRKAKIDKRVLNKKRDSTIHSVANIVHENTDVWSLTFLGTPEIVSVYAVYNLVINGLKQVVAVFTGSLEAPFGSMFAKGEKEGIEKNLYLHEFVSFSLISILYSSALLLLIPFISIYTRGVHDIQYVNVIYAFLVVLTGITYCTRTPYQTVVQAGGYYKETKFFAIIEAALNLAITFSLVPFLGLIGAAIGTLVANLFRTLTYGFYVYKKVLNISLTKLTKRMIWSFLNIFAIYCLANKFVILYASKGWLYWVASGFAVVAIALIVTALTSLIFYPDELKTLYKKTFVSRLFKRRRKL